MSSALTTDRVEFALDSIANMIVSMPKHADKLLLLYRRLESDLEEMKKSEDAKSAVMSSVMRRVTQQKDRTAARS